MRDLAAVGLMLEARPTARQRLETQLDGAFARTVERSLAPDPHHPLAPTLLGRSFRAA